jgi:plastocyanin
MKVKQFVGRRLMPGLLFLMAWGVLSPCASQALTTNVTVASFNFNPRDVTIHANDQVQWNWAAGSIQHSTTSDTNGIWDSALQFPPFTFSHTFASAGFFPYHCTLHANTFNMRGTVTVQGVANTPPSVALTSPTNNSVFAAPWTGVIQATASDSDGTVASVDFFAGATKLGTVSNPPPSVNFSFGVTNLAAGSYTLTAVATDNGGATNTSAGVSIQVLTPVPIMLSSPQRLSDSSFQFLYTATPGLSYVVKRGSNIAALAPISTNAVASSPVTFTDTNATDALDFYSVTLLPNP